VIDGVANLVSGGFSNNITFFLSLIFEWLVSGGVSNIVIYLSNDNIYYSIEGEGGAQWGFAREVRHPLGHTRSHRV